VETAPKGAGRVASGEEKYEKHGHRGRGKRENRDRKMGTETGAWGGRKAV